MHAASIQASFSDPSAASAHLPGLVSQVSALPGFVAGYWVALAGSKGVSMIVFDSEEHAQSFAEFVRNSRSDGVTPDSIEVGEVMAEA